MPGLTLANTAIITVILFDARDIAGLSAGPGLGCGRERPRQRAASSSLAYASRVAASSDDSETEVQPTFHFYHDPPQNVYIVIPVISVIV